jgi:cyanophycinase-like exopeptidase
MGSFTYVYGVDDVDDSFIWALRRQATAPPVVTTLRSHGGTGYNPYIGAMSPQPKSVSTFVVHSRAGSEDPFVLDWVRQTTLLWFAGGFQNEYWGTKLESMY